LPESAATREADVTKATSKNAAYRNRAKCSMVGSCAA
jgi:hypothetical protein